jgi:hypothetical protein
MGAPIANADGVPVRRGARRPDHAGYPARDVLNQDWLSERYAHSITYNARNYVNWTAGGRGNYECNSSRRIGLRGRHA